MPTRPLDKITILSSKVEALIQWPVYPHLKDDDLAELQSERKALVRAMVRDENRRLHPEHEPLRKWKYDDDSIFNETYENISRLAGEHAYLKEVEAVNVAIDVAFKEIEGDLTKAQKTSRRNFMRAAVTVVAAGTATALGLTKLSCSADPKPEQDKNKGR